jgi:AcrR family transcriptional regulator
MKKTRMRLSRAAQTEQNHERVLEAARRVFLARGFHVATLDQIANEAGFSKGVIYSHFASKADMFLALLERRIAERTAVNATIAEGFDGLDDFEELLASLVEASKIDPAWQLLVIEFRVTAARDRELNRRYAELHRRTLAGIAGLLERLFERAGVTPVDDPLELARHVIAFENGSVLEDAAARRLDVSELAAPLRRVIGAPPPPTEGAKAKRRHKP